MAAMGAYHRYLWNKIMPIVNSLPDELHPKCTSYHLDAMTLVRQEQAAAHHTADAASKQITTSIALCRHAWLCSATTPDDTRGRIKDLLFDGVGLFDAKMDEILNELQKMRKTGRSYSSQNYYRSQRQPWHCQYTYQPYRYQQEHFRPQATSSSSPSQHQKTGHLRPRQSFCRPEKKSK